MYLSIIIGGLVLLGLGIFGISLLLFKLNRYLGYATGLLAGLIGLSPLASFLNHQNGWFSQGGPGEVVGVTLVMLVSGSILVGSLAFWGYVMYQPSRD